MLTLRLPNDEHRSGLAERPSTFTPRQDYALSGSPAGAGGSMARELENACRHGALIERVAARHGLLPSLIAGLCSHRSGWGLALTPAGPDGTADFVARPEKSEHRASLFPPDGLGFRRGLMALDYDHHAFARDPGWRDPEKNIDAGVALIVAHRRVLRHRTSLQGQGLLRASLAALECGLEPVLRAIRRGRDVDSPTSGIGGTVPGAGRDVLARAQFFQDEGWD